MGGLMYGERNCRREGVWKVEGTKAEKTFPF